MVNSKIYLLLSILLFISCVEQSEKSIQANQPNEQTNSLNEVEQPNINTEENSEIYFYEVDSFGIDDFLGFELTKQELSNNFENYNWKKTPVTNKYDSEIIDTNITITNDQDTIVLYQYEDKYMIEWAVIHGSEIDIYSNIHVGQTKKELKLIFSDLDTTNSIIRTGISGPFSCTLYFDGSKISFVEYIGYID